MNPVLSVLVCTLPSRLMSAMGVIHRLEEQARGCPVEIIYLGDNKCMPVGEKRNWLLAVAHGEYVCFVDDDDRVAPDYVEQILKALETKPDCAVFHVDISENHGPYKKVYYDKDFPRDANYPDHYERWPNHLMPVKREIACDVRFPKTKSSGEDFDYAKGLHEQIKTQVKIEKTLYVYDYNQATSETPR